MISKKTLQGDKYLWLLPEHEHGAGLDLAAHYNLSLPIIQTLLSRGFIRRDQLDDFLFSSFEKDVADPALLKDADKAVDRILYALKHEEKILIAGDYDVDGITSASVMLTSLLPLKAQVNFFLPNRVRDGYGLSVKTVERAAKAGYKLIITVDNGITAFDAGRVAHERGIDLIITDHHIPGDVVPQAYAIINPHQLDCAYPYKHFAGVGVGFKLMSLLYQRLGRELPHQLYELLLLGTIADVVPLTGENRFWVRHGLNLVNARSSYAFNVLKQNGNVTRPRILASDIGYNVTPQINALGRLEDPRQGVKFLIGADRQETDYVGRVLLELNETRKRVERAIFEDVDAQIQSGRINLARENIIMAASDQWPAGVIGLVASRFVSAYGKPTLLFHLTKDGIAKGSCRSIPEFNMYLALKGAREHITQFGGHPMAAGLALPVDNLPLLKAALEERIARELTPLDLTQKLTLDAALTMQDLTSKFMHDLSYLEPFGCENRAPYFYLNGVSLTDKPRLLKDLHVKCSVFADGVMKPLMFFNRPELYEKLMLQEQDPFDLVVQVTENHWNGRVNLELTGVDIGKLRA